MQLRNKESGELSAKRTKFNDIAVTGKSFPYYEKQKKHFIYSSVNVFSAKVLIWDTIFMSRTGDRTAILRGHPRYSKVVACSAKRNTFNSQLF